jgi:heat shock protein HslJ
MVMSILRYASGALLAGIFVLSVAGASVAKSPPASPRTSGPTLAGTLWALQQLAVDATLTDVPSDVAATLFLQDGQASGDAGCNTFSGDYSIDGDALTFGPMMSTMMICEGEKASTEAAYLAGFPLVASYSLDGEALSLLDGGGDPVMTYAAVAAQPIAGSWVVTSYEADRNDTAPPIAGSLLTAVFGADGTIEGDSGCNHFSGPYTIDGDGIAIGPLASTLVACASSELQDQEAQYLALLTASDKWSQDGGGLELIDTQGVGRQTTVMFSAANEAAYLGSWDVAGFDDGSGAVVSPVSGSALTAVFQPDGTIEGSAGCNTFSGPYTAIGTSMTIGPLATTRMACSSPALDTQEQQYLTALQSVATWEADEGITLRDWGGAAKVSLTAVSPE